jgi:hypothetical protein
MIVLATDSVAISGSSREVPENCAVPCHYAACSGNFLPTFRDNLFVPSSGLFSPEYGTIGCAETSVRNYHYTLRNDTEQRSSQLKSSLNNAQYKYQKTVRVHSVEFKCDFTGRENAILISVKFRQ